MRTISLTLILVWIGTIYVSAQNRVADSLIQALGRQGQDTLTVNTLAALYNHYLYNDPTRALGFARNELELSEELGYRKGIGMGNYHIGVYFNNLSHQDSAAYYYALAGAIFRDDGNLQKLAAVTHGEAILKYNAGEYDGALEKVAENIRLYTTEIPDSVNLALSYDLAGTLYYFKGEHDKALEEALKGFKILERLDKPIRLADALGHLGMIEFGMHNLRKSIAYNEQALEIYRAHNDKYYEAQALNDIGNAYFYLEEYEKAIGLLKQSMALSESQGASDLQATAAANIGKCLRELKRYPEAILYLQESLRLLENTGNIHKTAESLLYLGRTYARMGQPKRSLEYFSRVIAIADSLGVPETQSAGYNERAEAYAALGLYEKAYPDYKVFKAMNDSVFNTEKSRQIEEMRARFDTEKKEQQITVQEGKIALLESEAKVGNLQRILLGSGLLLALLGFYGVRQKWKRSKAEKKQVDAELAFNKKELTTHALHLAKKNELLENLMQQAQEMKACENTDGYKRLIQTIRFDQHDDRNWDNFTQYFEKVHKDFSRHVQDRFPEVTQNELRFMALLKMNLSSKEIGAILNISPDGVKKARQRLRRKLDLAPEASLEATVHTL